MAKKRVLIVGGTGRIGSAVAQGLAGEYEFLRTSRRATPGDAAEGLYRADVGGTPEALARLARGVDTIYALAAQGWDSEFDDVAYQNIRGAYNVYEAARRAGVRRVLFASTNHVYEGYRGTGVMVHPDMPTLPGGLYAASKVFGEALGRVYSHRYGLSVIALRIGNFPPDDLPREASVDRWMSARDMCQMVHRAIRAGHLPYAVLNATSESDNRWMSLDEAERLIGYVPQDNGSEILRARGPIPLWHIRRRTAVISRVEPRTLAPGAARRVVLCSEDGDERDALLEGLRERAAAAGERWEVEAPSPVSVSGQPEALAQATDGADTLVYLAPRLRYAEFDEVEQHLIRGAYHACESARRAGVRRLVVVTDWYHYAGYRGRSAVVSPEATPYPVTIDGAGHVWAEAVAHAYHHRYGLSVGVVRRGDLTPDDRPTPGLGDVWLSRADLAHAVWNQIAAPDVTYSAVHAASCGAPGWLGGDGLA